MGSAPNWTYGYVPTAAQWNAAFVAKQDDLGYTPVNRAGDTMTGPLITFGSLLSGSGLRISPGVAPNAPVDGDVWITSAGFYARVNGTTLSLLVNLEAANVSFNPFGTNLVATNVQTAIVELDDDLDALGSTVSGIGGGLTALQGTAVRTDIVQSFSDGQMAQGRGNIGAASAADLTPFVAYTPTFTGFGTVTNVYALSRRVGNALEVMGNFTTGTGTATEARMSLGFNGVDGGLEVSTLMGATGVVGFGTINITTANQPFVMASQGNSYVKFSLLGSTMGGLTARNGNDLFGNGTVVSLRFTVPIQDW